MDRQKKCACGALELSSDDILFLLSCIESSERQDLKIRGRKALYVRLVQIYVKLNEDRFEPASTLKQSTLEVVK
jgi:hypothetical protein